MLTISAKQMQRIDEIAVRKWYITRSDDGACRLPSCFTDSKEVEGFRDR